MSAFDTAKEIVRMTSTAGLSKDVIDLLEKKLALITNELTEANRKVAALETENAQLRAQLPAPAFAEHMGVLWKRTPTGFEQNPYCKECKTHSVMRAIPRAGFWLCATGDHQAPLNVKPPAT